MLTLFALEREVNIGCANIEIRQIFFKKLFETAYSTTEVGIANTFLILKAETLKEKKSFQPFVYCTN